FLQGAYQDTIMLDSLRAKGKVPVQSPYADALMVNDSALVFCMKGGSSIVDWVEIELRISSDGASVAKQSALVRRDGRIVDENGNMPVRFPNLEVGDYYVIIRHQNHIAIMTNEKVRLE
ncbi:MAG: hemagglutinin protein, partial [Bacteroidota bacterium]